MKKRNYLPIFDNVLEMFHFMEDNDIVNSIFAAEAYDKGNEQEAEKILEGNTISRIAYIQLKQAIDSKREYQEERSENGKKAQIIRWMKDRFPKYVIIGDNGKAELTCSFEEAEAMLKKSNVNDQSQHGTDPPNPQPPQPPQPQTTVRSLPPPKTQTQTQNGELFPPTIDTVIDYWISEKLYGGSIVARKFHEMNTNRFKWSYKNWREKAVEFAALEHRTGSQKDIRIENISRIDARKKMERHEVTKNRLLYYYNSAYITGDEYEKELKYIEKTEKEFFDKVKNGTVEYTDIEYAVALEFISKDEKEHLMEQLKHDPFDELPY